MRHDCESALLAGFTDQNYLVLSRFAPAPSDCGLAFFSELGTTPRGMAFAKIMWGFGV